MPDLSWNLIAALANKQLTSPPSAASVTASTVTLSLSKGDLARDVAQLLTKLQIGDVLKAIVLRPQAGQDFIEIAGQPLAAQLPPDIHPGETLALQVTELTPSQITVRNLGLLESAPTAAPTPPPPTAPNSNVTLSLSKGGPATVLLRQAQRDTVSGRAGTPAAVHTAVQNAVKQIARTVTDLLKAVKLPDTPLTRMVATVAPQAPIRLPQTLARLEAALPQQSTDPRIATLKTLIAFTSRLNLQNESTLPAQIEAYVSHVLEGAEPKLSQLLAALSQTTASPQPQTHSQTATVAEPAPQPGSKDASAPRVIMSEPRHGELVEPQPSLSRPQGGTQTTTIAQARAAERTAAIDHDLKSVVLSLMRNPPQDRTPALLQALGDAHITLTAAQFNALTANAQTPGTIAFSLPAYFYEGGKPAQLRISREQTGNSQKLTADDFHVAFVLDTANLGTVAIDLQSSGRSVKIDVKTEQRTAAARFSNTLHALRARLEHLRYRVASAGAAVIDRKPQRTPQIPQQNPPQNSARLDLRA